MVRILVDNNKSRLIAPSIDLMEYRDAIKIKSPGAWFSPMYHKWTVDHNGKRVRVWDGYVRYISERTGMFSTGLLPQVCEMLKKKKVKYTLEDTRDKFKVYPLPKDLGGLDFRDYQFASIRSALDNRYEGVKFQRGILDEATNAGKSLIAGGIFISFHGKRNGIFLVNTQDLFNQAVEDLTALLGKDVVGYVSSKKTLLKRINVCMVQTLGNRIKTDPKIRAWLAKCDIVIVDEADELIGRKDCKAILATAFNATVRIALSGTPLKHKDPTRNQELIAFFGPILHRTSNAELVVAGVSTKPDIRMYLGNNEVREPGDYALEYSKGIIKNKKRHRRIWKLVRKFENKLPCIILFKEHLHAKKLLETMPEDLKHLRVKYVHGKVKNRKAILKEFNDGKLDILIASFIIKRGLNLPRCRVFINAAGGRSWANVLQILGRALRKHVTKKKVYFFDFWDKGKYLETHSRKRKQYYEKETFEVKTPYKNQLKKLL